MMPIPTSVSSVFSLISGWISAIKSSPPGAAFFTAAAATAAGFLWWPPVQRKVHLPSHSPASAPTPPDRGSDSKRHMHKRGTVCRKHSKLPFFHPSAEDWDSKRTDTCHKVWVCMSWLFLFVRSFVREKAHMFLLRKRMEMPCRIMFSVSLRLSESLSLSLLSSVLLFDLLFCTLPLSLRATVQMNEWSNWMDYMWKSDRKQFIFACSKKVKWWPRIIFC